jgi:SAM domain (Sterile alpha motif)
VQDIADWLDKLGMAEYAQRFAENRIDFSVLPDLTDQDLEKMGVVLGDRRKILRAIAGLDDAEKAAQKPGASVEATSAVRPRQNQPPDDRYGSWLCKNSTTRGGARTNVRPTAA